MDTLTESELAFEDFAKRENIPIQRIIFENVQQRRPDYQLVACGCTIYFEVKEFGLNPLEKEIKKNLEETGWASGEDPVG